jgi:hypothetical protein
MKRKLLYASTIALIVLSVASCKTVRWSTRDAATLHVTKSGVYTKPKVADLKIENIKVNGSATGNIKEKSIATVKNEALQNALKTAQADILVEPIYEVDRDGKVITARVSGFPAKVTSFKDITADDTLAFSAASKFYIRAANLNASDASSQAAEKDAQTTKKKRARNAGLGLGLGLGLPLVLGLGLGFGLGGM